MTKVAIIRNAIIAKLNEVEGIGLVHGYERYAVEERAFKALYMAEGKLLGWFVRREGVVEKPLNGTVGDEETRWIIRGFMGLSDADQSELVFDDLIDAIRDAFRADDRLGGAVISCTTEARAGIELLASEPVMFANTLCHSARLGLTTKTLEQAPEQEITGSLDITASLEGDAPQNFGGQM